MGRLSGLRFSRRQQGGGAESVRPHVGSVWVMLRQRCSDRDSSRLAGIPGVLASGSV